MSAVLQRLNADLDALMDRISTRLGNPRYRLTLVCRYEGDDLSDADILKSDDDLDKAVAAIRRLQQREPIA